MTTVVRHAKPKGRPCSHRRYLIDCEQYEELRRRADYRCEICGSPEEEELHGVLSVDHRGSLADWAVRGLLCNRCNTGLHLPAISGEARDRFYANAWYVEMLSRLGLTPDLGPEPPLGSVVIERGRTWVRCEGGWVCQSRNAPSGARSWKFLFRRYGPHNLTLANWQEWRP